MRPYPGLAALILTIAAITPLVGCARQTSPPPSLETPRSTSRTLGPAKAGQAGSMAPAFTGTTRDGKPFRLADYPDKTLLVNVFMPG